MYNKERLYAECNAFALYDDELGNLFVVVFDSHTIYAVLYMCVCECVSAKQIAFYVSVITYETKPLVAFAIVTDVQRTYINATLHV